MVRVDAKVCHVDVDGRVVQAAPRGSLFGDLGHQKNPIAVGDEVVLSDEGSSPGIERVLPRRNWLGRTASSHDPREQVLVANVDQLLIISSLVHPAFSSHRTDRILAACLRQGIPPVLVLNKIDLAEADDVEDVRATYERIPVPVLATSALDGRGLDAFAARLQDRVSVLYGPSGAGKSTLINRVQPGLDLAEGRISAYWRQGRHTTTFSTLHRLDPGGWVIDTPGIRVFRLHGLAREELRDLFPDFAPFQRRCRFPDCTHDHEPDCAVWDAVESGALAASRYASYVELLDEIDPERGYQEGGAEPQDE